MESDTCKHDPTIIIIFIPKYFKVNFAPNTHKLEERVTPLSLTEKFCDQKIWLFRDQNSQKMKSLTEYLRVVLQKGVI